MPTQSLRETKLLGEAGSELHARTQLDRFLRAHLPPFTAPTDPKAWRRQIPRLQREALRRVYLRGIPHRIVKSKPRVVWGETLRPDDSYVIRKVRYEAYPNYWIPALLYEPADLPRGVRVPVVLNPNGHHRGGKAALYKQARCANIARRGMLALSTEFIGMSELEADCLHNNIAHLDLTGMAGVGLFYLALKKGLDVLLAHRRADSQRVAVTGLSGGGWQTIVISALDPRVTLSVPVAGYTAIRARLIDQCDVGDMEQTPADMTTVADYDTLTAMLAPRPALLILNEHDDCCFATPRARPVIYDAVRPTYEAMGAGDVFATYSNIDPGTHNYEADNRSQFYKFIKRHFALPADTPETDMHRPEEILPEDGLRVGLPAAQTTMLGLARRRAEDLVGRLKTPRSARQKRKLRGRLRQLLGLPEYDFREQSVRREAEGENLLLHVGPWTLPASVEGGRKGESAVLIIHDQGRAAAPSLPIQESGTRVRVDLLGAGELRYDPLYLMIVNACGQRVLGVQVAQALAAARWAARRSGAGRVHAIAEGYNSAMALLVAAALEPALFESLTNYSPVTTLRYLMDWPLRYEEAPGYFLPGLLEVADVPQLRALMEGVEYRQPGRCVAPDRR